MIDELHRIYGKLMIEREVLDSKILDVKRGIAEAMNSEMKKTPQEESNNPSNLPQ